MSLLQQIKNDQLAARKARDTIRAELLTTLIGEASMIGKNDGGRETTDAEVTAVVKKFIKNANELINAVVADGGSVAKSFEELKILHAYLPKQLSDEELSVAVKAIVDGLVATVGAKPKMGEVLNVLKLQHNGQYDGKTASAIVKAVLS